MKFVPSLNSLRFFGAASVIFLHLGSYQLFLSHGMEKWHVLVSGSTGVSLFFVLSGYLLTTIALEEISKKGRFSPSQFFWRRAFRLFPLYFFSLGIIYLIQQIGLVDISPVSYLFALTYSYNMIPRHLDVGQLGPYHTLATEEQFYVFLLLFSLFLEIYYDRVESNGFL
jgi:peptidoglycan/LPS O-acetylase OafA/YrhL